MEKGNENTLKIAVVSAVGGTGRTTITVNLASVMASRGLRPIIIDGDLQFGDIAMALNLKPNYTITDVAKTKDFDNILFYCMKHSSGIQILAAPTRPEYADIVPNQLLKDVMENLSEKADILLVEAESGLRDRSLEVMEQADIILLVTAPSLHILKNTRLMLETLEALGLKEKTSVVLNQYNQHSSLGMKRVQDILTLEDICQIADDPKHVQESFDLGIPLVTANQKLPFTKDLIRLTDRLVGKSQPPKKRDSVLSSFKFFPKGLEGDKL